MRPKLKKALNIVVTILGAFGWGYVIWNSFTGNDEAPGVEDSVSDSISDKENTLRSIPSVYDEETIEIQTMPVSRSPHEVSSHLRTLPEGWHASEDKRNSASENGYILADNQTWVKPYSTGNRDGEL